MFRDLTRKNKQIDNAECICMLKEEKRGMLSVNGDDGYPYAMPMNHYYNDLDGCIYFHCGKTGYRLDCLKKSYKVSFCVCEKGSCANGDWALTVRSVVVFGKMEIIDDLDMIVDICDKLSRKFTSDQSYIDSEIKSYAKATLLLRLVPEYITGKIVEEK